MVGKVMPCLSMNSWKSSSLPVQATPTKLTRPAHSCAAASTEAASRLQVLQVGAQNHSAKGVPAKAAPSKLPPPTSGAVNCSESGTGAAATVLAGTSAVGEVAPVVVAAALVPAVEGVGGGDVCGAVALSALRPHAVSAVPAATTSDIERNWRRSMVTSQYWP
jgi:hypothetical protein